MRVSAQVIEDVLGAAKRWFRVDDPLRVGGRRKPCTEGPGITQRFEVTEEAQRARSKCAVQLLQEMSAEEAREHPNRQEEAGATGDPTFAVRCNTAARNDAMNVRVVKQILAQGMQDRDEADLGTQVLRVAGNRAHCLGAGAK